MEASKKHFNYQISIMKRQHKPKIHNTSSKSLEASITHRERSLSLLDSYKYYVSKHTHQGVFFTIQPRNSHQTKIMGTCIYMEEQYENNKNIQISNK